ncbi:uncharacterized protein MYCFIDRAFT_78338 [Pseudocercospora fijiensis CIRAD86]|uniref:Uncharacterized protein n=1 Tax=Pseudocercospora fijiensis (strain CIRAD86) TaxID=383855 RepID=M3ANC4_PSEFD|nr:uncharacterized protein MYCFIDRAFT_78338 [Pseudocercospora fijiensis CIRAD86]EME78628.1 hypothetical protein MYCFIDRAFT_78338 [Pseudocercospora fijiensis CIRAD86]
MKARLKRVRPGSSSTTIRVLSWSAKHKASGHGSWRRMQIYRGDPGMHISNQLWYSNRASLNTSSSEELNDFNPLFYDTDRAIFYRSPFEITTLTSPCLDAETWISAKDILKECKGSWRRMRLFGFDARSRKVQVYGLGGKARKSAVIAFEVEGGVTAGELISILRKWLKEHANQSNGSIWEP